MKILKPFEGGNLGLMILIQTGLMLVLWVLAPMSLLPSPMEVASSFNKLAQTQGLLVELMNSAITITKALIYSSLISAAIAYSAAATIVKPVAKGITALRFLGFAGITFAFTILTDNSHDLKVWLLVFGMVVFQLTNMLAVTEGITQAEVDYAKTLGLGPFQSVYEILVRGKAHDFLDIIRQNAAIGWVMLSMVEGLVRSEGGIGALLLIQGKNLHLSSIFAIQLTILLYGVLQDYLLGMLRLALCPYIKYTNVKG